MTTPLKDSQVSVRLPNALKDKMETYAQLTGRTKSYVAMEALGEYLDWRVPQIEDLEAAVAAADSGAFAEAHEVQAVLSSYEKTPLPKTVGRPGRAARRT